MWSWFAGQSLIHTWHKSDICRCWINFASRCAVMSLWFGWAVKLTLFFFWLSFSQPTFCEGGAESVHRLSMQQHQFSRVVTWEAGPLEWVMLLKQKLWQQKCGESDESPCCCVSWPGLGISSLAFPFRLLPLRARSLGDVRAPVQHWSPIMQMPQPAHTRFQNIFLIIKWWYGL